MENLNLAFFQRSEIGTFEKRLNEAQWYLGEEREKCSRYESELREKAQHIEKVERELSALKERCGESEWYLGEERFKREQLENILKDTSARCQDLEKQVIDTRNCVQELQRELRDAQWYLGVERAKNASK